MNRGYIAIWRKIQDHPFYKEPREFSKYEAWLDLLMEAQHNKEPREVILGMNVLTCHYGETLKSIKTWSSRWMWTRSKVFRFLKLLKKMNQIRYTSEKITTRIKIINYECYDPRRNADETQMKRKRNDHETVANTDKNVKNNNTPPTPLSMGTIYSKSFLDWYELYPEKKGKGAAYRSWQKIGKKGIVTPNELMAAIAAQVKANHFRGRDGQDYIPNPSTWLNQNRWEDEIKNNKAQSNTLPEVMENPYG